MADVKISNKLSQKIEVGIKNASGTLESVAIQANDTFGPVPEDRVGEYTNNLAKLGLVKIRTVS